MTAQELEEYLNKIKDLNLAFLLDELSRKKQKLDSSGQYEMERIIGNIMWLLMHAEEPKEFGRFKDNVTPFFEYVVKKHSLNEKMLENIKSYD